MAGTVYNITFSSANLWIAEVGTPSPAAGLGYGLAWPTGWLTPSGYEGAVNLKLENTLAPKIDDRVMGAVGHVITDKKASMSITLNYFDLENLNLAWGGTLTEVAAAVGVPAYKHLAVGSQSTVKNRLWGVEGFWDDNGTRRASRAIMMGNALKGSEIVYDRKKQIGIKLEIEAVFDLSKPTNSQLVEMWQHIGDAL